MARQNTVRYTYQDYLTIPEDTSRRYEIVDGELHVSAAPRFRHQEVVRDLLNLLHDIVRSHDLGVVVPGPVTVRLHDELVVEPDIVFVRRDRIELVDREGAIHGAPDLVVEVLSPSNRAYDRDLKRKRYLENGVREVWIVDADKGSVEVWTPSRNEPIRHSESIEWEVGGETFPLSLEGVFGGSEPS